MLPTPMGEPEPVLSLGVAFLGHFCETHGPQMLFVSSHTPLERRTQVLRAPEEDSSLELSVTDDEGTTSRLSFASPPRPAVPCRACASVGDGQGMVSHGPGGFVVSTRAPEPALYATLRSQCVRSLSCEHVPGTEYGPVLFSEDNRVATLSYLFHLVDGEARGSTRQFCFCCVSLGGENRVFAQCTEVRRRFDALASDLKDRASRSFRAESEVVSPARRSPAKSGQRRSLAELTHYQPPDALYRVLHDAFVGVLHEVCDSRALAVAAPPLTPLPLGAASGPYAMLFDALGEDRFALLADHVLCGRPVVVRRSHAALAPLSGVLSVALRMLVPSEDSDVRRTLVSEDVEGETAGALPPELLLLRVIARDEGGAAAALTVSRGVDPLRVPVPSWLCGAVFTVAARHLAPPAAEAACVAAVLAQWRQMVRVLRHCSSTRDQAQVRERLQLTDWKREQAMFAVWSQVV